MQNYLLIIASIIIVIALVYMSCTKGKELFTKAFEQGITTLEGLQYVDLGDHRTIVQLQKGDSGKTVLLLHNSPMNLNLWQPLFQTMQRISMSGIPTPNLVAYDIRGHGTAWIPVENRYNDSVTSNYAWPLELFVQDCKKVCDTIIGEGKIKICGFGFGGVIGQKFALTYPERVEKLVLLQTTIRPMQDLWKEIEYLSGPTGWIAKNPNVTYLTSQERFVQQTLCDWFYLPKESRCPSDPSVEKYPDNNDQSAFQYNLTARMWRQSSSTTTLQADKLLVSTDMEQEWINAKNVKFPIHILAATDDPLAPPDMMTDTYTTIYNNNRTLMVALDVVKGRHGFTIMRPDYIANIICDACVQSRDG